MESERWRRLEELVAKARDLAVVERSKFLDEACAEDTALRREVESLIVADAAVAAEPGEGDFLRAIVSGEIERWPGDDWIGRRVGAYEILGELGRGGMSRVFLAVRADRQFEQRVAIKVIRRELDSRELESRFRRERQILAQLEHPYIARLIDGGLTSEGRPYLVMEQIDGQPIDLYCDARRLSVRQRLTLLLRVCEAVQQAHRNLIVHRDLKPSNILVTADGMPKLLDFGIAKLLDPQGFPQTVLPTDESTRAMTPEYASPEQVRGETVTTASDVYALGILLYELLTGRRPYRLPRRLSPAAERVICEARPPLPSTTFSRPDKLSGDSEEDDLRERSARRRTSPDKLRRQLAGDLDRILLMALRKEPERRYASVEALAEDLRRHLAGLPVSARRDTPGYRLGKFVGRHRAAVAAAVVALVAIVGGVATAIWQARQATLAQVAAEEERERAEQVSTFLRQLFEVSDPDIARGANLTARELLDRGAERLEVELAGQPRLQATLLDTIGSIYLDLGLYDRAIELLNEALTRRRRAGADAETALTLDILAGALHEKGDSAAAEPLFREALEMRRQLFGGQHPQVAASLNNLGELLHDRGELAAAEELLREALEMKRRLMENEHTWVADGLNKLAGVLSSRGDFTAAEPLFREALDMRSRLLGDDHPQVAESLNNLAFVLYRQDKLAAAEPLFRQTLALRRRLFDDNHPAVARSVSNLAKVLYRRGRHGEAEPLYRQTLATKRALLDADNPSIAVTLNGLALVLAAIGQTAEAEALFREALELRQGRLAAGHPAIAESQLGLGKLLAENGQAAEAEALLSMAHATLAQTFGDDDRRTREALLTLTAIVEQAPARQASRGAPKAHSEIAGAGQL